MKAWPHPIRAIIFDNDGLLLDTEGIYAVVHEELTGHHLDWDFRRQLMGLTGPDACSLIVKKYGFDEDPIHYMNRRDAKLVHLFPDAKLFPGAIEIVKAFIDMKIPLALATSSHRGNFDNKISKKHDFYNQFPSVVTGDEVSKGKPDPEIFIKSMEKLGISGIKPENVLVFEDAPAGVRGANNAGMPVIMIPDPELPMPLAIDELGAKPTLIIKSLNDFDFNSFEWAPPQ